MRFKWSIKIINHFLPPIITEFNEILRAFLLLPLDKFQAVAMNFSHIVGERQVKLFIKIA